MEQLTYFKDLLRNLQSALSTKNAKDSKIALQLCLDHLKPVIDAYHEFSQTCKKRSEMVRYFDGVLKLTDLLKNLIAADREGNWHAHLQAIQDILPVLVKPEV